MKAENVRWVMIAAIVIMFGVLMFSGCATYDKIIVAIDDAINETIEEGIEVPKPEPIEEPIEHDKPDDDEQTPVVVGDIDAGTPGKITYIPDHNGTVHVATPAGYDVVQIHGVPLDYVCEVDGKNLWNLGGSYRDLRNGLMLAVNGTEYVIRDVRRRQEF